MSWRLLLILAAVHGLLAVWFLSGAGPGFPLDDTWVHAVYARAFAAGEGFAYNPGQLEVGVTAPLWTVLLALPVGAAEALGQRPDLLVRILGALFGLGAAYSGTRLAGRAGRWPMVFAGLALSLDPWLVYERFSGMEAPLFAWLAMLYVGALLDGRESRSGWLGGLLVLTRPEALVLVVLGGTWIAHKRQRLGRFVVPILVCALPWMAYCFVVSGRPWPSTFENKALAVLEPRAVVAALGALAHDTGWGWSLPFTLLVGMISLEGGRRDLGSLPLLLGGALLGAVLLSRAMPVAEETARVPYYWARYGLLAWPLLLLVMSAGVASLVRTAWAGLLCRPVYALLLVSPLLLVAVTSLELPGKWSDLSGRYAAECGDVETLNVAAARWIDANLPADALVATHDAGAIRYFGGRRVLDIWGNHDQQRMRAEREGGPRAALTWMREQRADALVVFPIQWAPGHSPEAKALWQRLPPHEYEAIRAMSEDYAELLGITERAETFRLPGEAHTVPGPLHRDLAVFVRP